MLRLTKMEIYKAVVDAAEKQRKPGENEHVARARFWQSPEGQRARKPPRGRTLRLRIGRHGQIAPGNAPQRDPV